MIFAVTISQVRSVKWNPEASFVSYQYSKDDVLDLVECDQNVYQVMKDGTVQMRGMKYGLLNKESFEFVKLDISSVSRVFCVKNNFFWYLTKSGQLMAEDDVENGKLKFALFAEHVLDVQSRKNTIFILTTEGLFVEGDCSDFICGVEDTDSENLIQIDFTTQFTSPIVSFRLHDQSDNDGTINLFLYLENGDVYLTGKPDDFPIAQNSVPIRKIGSRFKSAYLGKNEKFVQIFVLYYLKGTDLMMFSNVLSPTEQLLHTGVLDVTYIKGQLVLLKENVEIFYEDSQKNEGVDLYCQTIPSDTLCIKKEEYTFDQVTDCLNDSPETVCKLTECANGKICDFALDCQSNATCWALWCQQSYQITKHTPQCYTHYQNITITVPDSKNSFFRGMYIQRQESTERSQQQQSFIRRRRRYSYRCMCCCIRINFNHRYCSNEEKASRRISNHSRVSG
ncbi:Regulator_of chromosome condensation 1/beta-lactamase-inhibitor protein II [Hexamita inflata]|uniref:Regulator of chromosome condensation 1/beta-lactamase-inhibitor protein II n=1 Tax=Hexamita inflata TaxID=28002 RepID=A0AA86NTZ5_9EUKA|nr:Regulator of chromosome condensation 1/beta-lactamase-inhibitor protein II [Hexamita inflata]